MSQRQQSAASVVASSLRQQSSSQSNIPAYTRKSQSGFAVRDRSFSEQSSDRTKAVKLLITNLDKSFQMPKGAARLKEEILSRLENAWRYEKHISNIELRSGKDSPAGEPVFDAFLVVTSTQTAQLIRNACDGKLLGRNKVKVEMLEIDLADLSRYVVSILKEAAHCRLAWPKFSEFLELKFGRKISVAEVQKRLHNIVTIEFNGQNKVVTLTNPNSTSPRPVGNSPSGGLPNRAAGNSQSGQISNRSINSQATGVPSRCGNSQSGETTVSRPLGSSHTGEIPHRSEPIVCEAHCPVNSLAYHQLIDLKKMPDVRIAVSELEEKLDRLLVEHSGSMPLLSFEACYASVIGDELPIIEPDWKRSFASAAISPGVPLEHLISCCSKVEIITNKAGNKILSRVDSSSRQQKSAKSTTISYDVNERLHHLSREVIELLRSTSGCRMVVGRFVKEYYNHFKRHLLISEYFDHHDYAMCSGGGNQVLDLCRLIPQTVQIMGLGDNHIVTLTHAAQVNRFTTDILRVLKSHPAKQIHIYSQLPLAYQRVLNRPWSITDYGVCYIEDMLRCLPPQTISAVCSDEDTPSSTCRPSSNPTIDTPPSEATSKCTLILTIVNKTHSVQEAKRLKDFATEVISLLRHQKQFSLLFNKFITSYQQRTGRQLRLSDYGYTKLLDLLDAIPHAILIRDDCGDKCIQLTEPEALDSFAILTERLLSKSSAQEPLVMESFLTAFRHAYGWSPLLRDFGVSSVHQLLSLMPHVVPIDDDSEAIRLITKVEKATIISRLLFLLMEALRYNDSPPRSNQPIIRCLGELSRAYERVFLRKMPSASIYALMKDCCQMSGKAPDSTICLSDTQRKAAEIRNVILSSREFSLAGYPLSRLPEEYHSVYKKPVCADNEPMPSAILKLLKEFSHIFTVVDFDQSARGFVQFQTPFVVSLPVDNLSESKTAPHKLFNGRMSSSPSDIFHQLLPKPGDSVLCPRSYSTCGRRNSNSYTTGANFGDTSTKQKRTNSHLSDDMKVIKPPTSTHSALNFQDLFNFSNVFSRLSATASTPPLRPNIRTPFFPNPAPTTPGSLALGSGPYGPIRPYHQYQSPPLSVYPLIGR